MESLTRNTSFNCENGSETDTETDTEHSSCMFESSCDVSSSFNSSGVLGGKEKSFNQIDEALSISFPEHRAVVFPKDQSFSYICEADTEDEPDSGCLQSSGVSLDQSDIISDQDLRFRKELQSSSQRERKPDIPAIPASEIVDDSCVAVFHGISGVEEERAAEELTFNGKIPLQKVPIHLNVEVDLNNTSTSILDSSQASLQIDLSFNANANASQTSISEKLEKPRKSLYSSEQSPDILDFESEDEAAAETTDEISKCDITFLNSSLKEDDLTRRERKLLKRLQNALAGVLPPPSFTKSLLSVETILSIYEKNLTQQTKEEAVNEHLETLMKPLNSVQEATESAWPDAKNVFTHGIHYNRSKFSERIESMSTRYADRFIGAETSSSFVKLGSPSSAKKRYAREKSLNQSPGRRLSHLAKRKAMFSCANLQKINFSNSQPCLSQPSTSRQIMLGPSGSRKNRVRTPKRLSPAQRKTPKSKQQPAVKAPPTRETSKRALFQSPPQQSQSLRAATPELAERVDRSRRALFSSPKLSRYSSFSQQSSSSFSSCSLTAAALANRENLLEEEAGGKRKRGHLEDDQDEARRKVARMEGAFGRSQSFTAEYVARQNALLASRPSLCKTTSDVCLSGRRSTSHANFLTDLEKQRLLYIVSQTLQRKQISGQHEKFKEYATVMARVVKRLFLEASRKTFGSVSEQMSKIANNILFSVLQGKSVEEIYAAERKKREQAKNSQKPSGYVSMESYRSGLQRSTSSVLSENSRQSFGMSQNSLRFSQSENLSQSQGSVFGSSNTDTGSILRENVDSEQRRSAQKGLFSGKDQKNVSPHKSSHKKQKLVVGGKNLTNLLKAKRQISFDT